MKNINMHRGPPAGLRELIAQVNLILFAVTSTIFVSPVLADLPVHCLRSQVAGAWTFYLDEGSKHRSSCGHLHPDIAEEQPGVSSFMEQLNHNTNSKRTVR